MARSFFKIEGCSVFPNDWGDYGDILQHGMSSHQPRRNGSISLERTGPYIPPVTFPGPIVLTTEARQLLESSGLSGLSFLPVVKAHIVELHWEEWDLNLDWPPKLPDSGEPEDYILAEPHNPGASDALGELWEITVPKTGKIISPERITLSSLMRPYKGFSFDSSNWNGADLFRSEGSGWMLCSERGRDWLTESWGRLLLFDPFPST
ncbi:MAG: hypothetical protein ABR905_08700 [Terracidiphilus sp.]|jgi:hypothetical protein